MLVLLGVSTIFVRDAPNIFQNCLMTIWAVLVDLGGDGGAWAR